MIKHLYSLCYTCSLELKWKCGKERVFMCGAFKIIDNPKVTGLTEFFGLPVPDSKGWANCGQKIQMIHQVDGDYGLSNAIWWLLLEPKEGKYKPHSKYTSFNSRWNPENGFSASAKKPFRESRCIIPANGFVEGMNKKYHYLEPVSEPVAFGGLYKTWETSDGPIYSCSIITIPPHPKFKGIHEKAMPLMLPVEDADLMQMWLDPSIKDTTPFLDLMKPELRVDYNVTPLKKWRSFEPNGEPFTISRD